jgi:hypothetical protein
MIFCAFWVSADFETAGRCVGVVAAEMCVSEYTLCQEQITFSETCCHLVQHRLSCRLLFGSKKEEEQEPEENCAVRRFIFALRTKYY